MDIGIISVRYARALFKAAQQQHIEDSIYENMKTLFNVILEENKLSKTLSNPILHKDSKERLLLTACGNQSSELLKKFIRLVLDVSREDMIQFIAASYITIYQRHKHIISGKLITATQVFDSLEQKIAKMIQNTNHSNVELQKEVDPSILGGFILEYDTYRMDASVKQRLNHILAELKS